MKKYTQEEFNNFEIAGGYRQCPSGDYSEIKSFGKCCSFGKYCKVENDVELQDHIKFEGFGNEGRCTYFFLSTENKIYVRCGCFFGNIEEFRAKVKKAYPDNKLGEGYFKMADFAEWRLGEDEE